MNYHSGRPNKVVICTKYTNTPYLSHYTTPVKYKFSKITIITINTYQKLIFWNDFLLIFLLSVQCNTLHGTEYKITCGVFLCVRTGIGGRISRKRLEIEVRLQWDTNRKWHMADRLVTWPMTSRDPERSKSWPRYKNCPLSRKWLKTETHLQ